MSRLFQRLQLIGQVFPGTADFFNDVESFFTFQLIKQFVHASSAGIDDLPCLAPGFFSGFPAHPGNFGAACLDLRGALFLSAVLCLQRCAHLFKFNSALPQFRHQCRKLTSLVSKHLPRQLDHPLRHAETLGNVKGVGLSRFACHQAVERRVTTVVVGHSGVEHAGGAVDEADDIGQMGRCDDRCPPFLEHLENAAGDCCPLERLGAGAKLVQQHQGTGTGLVNNARDACGVGREG